MARSTIFLRRAGLVGFAAILLLSAVGCSSGTGVRDLSERTVILISLDGFRADYMETFAPPNLSALASSGVHADEGMIPVFPTLTFPNHYSIATGLYPDGHGITDNTILDRETGKRFTIYDREAIEDPFWWGGEPIWVTAETQGVTTATFFWVGSEAPVKGVQPTYWKRFDAEISEGERVDQVLAWLDLPAEQRPVLLGMYFGSIDAAGHESGTDSQETEAAVLAADAEIGRLLEGLDVRGIRDRVNIVVLSDHGMANRSQERVIAVDDYIDITGLEIVTTSPILGINVPEGRLNEVVRRLDAAPNLGAWAKFDLPSRFSYGENARIPDVIALADEGWTIYRTREFMMERMSTLRGSTHGYDPAERSMRALFIADGPAFRDRVSVDPFECIHVYEMLAQVLDVTPAENDGEPDVLAPILER